MKNKREKKHGCQICHRLIRIEKINRFVNCKNRTEQTVPKTDLKVRSGLDQTGGGPKADSRRNLLLKKTRKTINGHVIQGLEQQLLYRACLLGERRRQDRDMRIKCSWNWLDPECLYVYIHFGFEINARDKMGNNRTTKIKDGEKNKYSVKGLLDGCQAE